jgi:hypothetical protein
MNKDLSDEAAKVFQPAVDICEQLNKLNLKAWPNDNNGSHWFVLDGHVTGRWLDHDYHPRLDGGDDVPLHTLVRGFGAVNHLVTTLKTRGIASEQPDIEDTTMSNYFLLTLRMSQINPKQLRAPAQG